MRVPPISRNYKNIFSSALWFKLDVWARYALGRFHSIKFVRLEPIRYLAVALSWPTFLPIAIPPPTRGEGKRRKRR